MNIVRCALGVVLKKGDDVYDPVVQVFGPDEAEYLTLHIEKVRRTTDASARSVFVEAAHTPDLLGALRDSSDDAFETTAKVFEDALASGMRGTTNAKDCVFAVVQACDEEGGDTHITLLKLDAVLEAAKMHLLANRRVTFEVLKDLLPEPGKLQKALSWPDPRPESEVIMLDTNDTSAQYFEIACQVHVSPKSPAAETELAQAIHTYVPEASLPAAVAAAAGLDGPLDVVLGTLSEDYPELQAPAAAAAASPRPAGIVRRNKVAALPLIWRTDGVEVRVTPELGGSVSVTQEGDGWRISVDTVNEPRLVRQTQ